MLAQYQSKYWQLSQLWKKMFKMTQLGIIQRSYWWSHCFETKIKLQGFSKINGDTEVDSENYNLGYNILRLFDVLPNLSFTTSETNGDY